MISQPFAMAVQNGPTEYDLGARITDDVHPTAAARAVAGRRGGVVEVLNPVTSSFSRAA
jgi:hypothetical protein